MKKRIALLLAFSMFFSLFFEVNTEVSAAEGYDIINQYSNDTLLAAYSTTEVVALYPEFSEYLAGELRAFKTDISVRDFNIDKNDIGSIYFSVMCENPDIFYVLPTSIDMTTDYNTDKLISIRPEYFFAIDEIPARIAEFNSRTESFLAGIDYGWDDVIKTRYIHDMLAQYVEYDTRYESIVDSDHELFKVQMRIYTSYGAIVDNNAVCEGYNLAFKYLLSKLGINSYYVQNINARHSWLMVQLGGNYYHIDITHDDPTFDTLGRANHKFFLKSDAYLKADGLTQHSSWVTSLKATDGGFDNYWWQDISTIIYRFGDYDYYVNQIYSSSVYSAVTRRNIYTGAEEVLVVNKTRWAVKNIPNAFWERAYTYLTSDGVYLYYNDTDNVYRMPIGGSSSELIYSKPATTTDNIYGIAFKPNGLLYVTIKESPNTADIISKIDIITQNPVTDPTEINYVLSPDGTLSYYKLMGVNVRIPETIDGIKVLALADSVFADNPELKSVYLPEGLVSIGNGAFSDCPALEEVEIPASVTYIGNNVFSGCPNITIKGYVNSAAHQYANDYNIHFAALDPLTDSNIPKKDAPQDNTEPEEEIPQDTVVTIHRNITLYVKKSKIITPKPDDGFEFSSNKPSVVTVNSKGVITGKKAGKAIVVVKNDSLVYIISVTVKNPKLKVKKITIKKGRKYTLKVAGSSGAVKYTISNKKIATISAKGKIKAKKKGKTTVTVTVSGIKLKCKVTVK